MIKFQSTGVPVTSNQIFSLILCSVSYQRASLKIASNKLAAPNYHKSEQVDSEDNYF